MATVLFDDRPSGGTDGIFPRTIIEAGGVQVLSPLVIALDREGPEVQHFERWFCAVDGHSHTVVSVYGKRHAMANLGDSKTFPHIKTVLSVRCKIRSPSLPIGQIWYSKKYAGGF